VDFFAATLALGFGFAIDLVLVVLPLTGIRNLVVGFLFSIEPHRDDQGMWRIKFSAPGNPAGVSMNIGGASRLAAELKGISEIALAERIDAAVSMAKTFRNLHSLDESRSEA